MKSPFLIYQNFLDTSECEAIAETVRVNIVKDKQDEEEKKKATPIMRCHEESQSIIIERFKEKNIVSEMEAYYTDFKYKGIEEVIFQQFPVTNGNMAEDPQCQSAVFKRKKWLRVNDRALTAVLWLKDYNETPPFNISNEVYGGKLEFPIYNFGFQPQKGTLVIYPADERFITITSSVLVGELQCARLQICSEPVWASDKEDFKGDFKVWFNDVV